MRLNSFFILVLGVAGASVLSCDHRDKMVSSLSPQIITRSRVSDGNPTRLQRVLAKARRGEPVTIGVIGGSITLGEHASDPSLGYADLVANWWREQFPDSKVTLINAGVENTGSSYGCLRVQRDLLSHHPDFVIVEFGVNDKDEQAAADTYEGVVRQIMMDPGNPAVMLLFMMHHTGTNAQARQSEIGRQYQLPMISYRDALWPEIVAGRMKLERIFADTVHPNDRGHALAAELIESFLQQTLDFLPDQIVEISPSLPPPRYTDLFAHTQLLDADQLQPVANTGWTYDSTDRSWRSARPGSSITFEMTGSLIDLLYYRCNGAFGTANVTIDQTPSIKVDSWFEQTWGGFLQSTELARALPAGRHRVRVDLLNQHNPQSTGDQFRIMGFGTAG